MDEQDKLITEAFKDSAFAAETYYGLCWVAYLSNGTAVVVPDSVNLLCAGKDAWRSDYLYTVPAAAGDPDAFSIQWMADALEKYAGAPCTSFELKSPRWVGRMTTAALGFKDVTDWHEAATKDALVKELIDAYA